MKILSNLPSFTEHTESNEVGNFQPNIHGRLQTCRNDGIFNVLWRLLHLTAIYMQLSISIGSRNKSFRRMVIEYIIYGKMTKGKKSNCKINKKEGGIYE